MFKKVASTGFGVLLFAILFLASQPAASAQPSMTFADIQQSYQVSRLPIPHSEIQYQEILTAENERFANARDALNAIRLQEADNIAEAEKSCGRDLSCINYLKAEGKRLVNDYAKALQKLKDIYGQRRQRLEASRKNFPQPERRIDDSLLRHSQSPRTIRGYERRIDDSLLRPGRG